ncbi:MAG: VWA domain-containing protein, partial [Acidobacteria bacterium]|nr:VWA domain-containing protein [Acidobacteriota bacterium]
MTFARIRRLIVLTLVGIVAAAPWSHPAAQQQAAPVFRANLSIVSVDVIVRDKDGKVVRGLTESDFELLEDGRNQDVRTFTFAEIQERPVGAATFNLLAGVEEQVFANTSQSSAAGAAAVPPVVFDDAVPTPMRSEDLAGRRLVILLFDTSSMEPEDVQRSVDSAREYVASEMSTADLVAVATVSTILNVITDFTSDPAVVTAALNQLSYSDGTEEPPPSASTVATDEEAAAATEDAAADAEAAELEMFNNDLRLRALRTLAESLTAIEQKKAILYFSAGMQRSGQDNQVELRAAINAAVRANVSIYPVDTRGLQAVVPGGDARQASGRGRNLFNGRGMSRQFSRLRSSQDTLVSLAADTGGQAFTDTNNFGEAFSRVQRDMSAYYLLGYSSSNKDKDGRFRRIQVRLKKGVGDGYKVESRSGYYADRDFAHTSKADRETLMEEQLFAAVSDTDLPVIASAMYFRMAADKYYVPVAVSVPGAAVPVTEGLKEITLDIMAQVMDERGLPVGKLRQTMKLPAGTEKTLAGKQILYQSGMVLPPGRFSIKAVVRENATGLMGSFEASIDVPELAQLPLKVSSVVLSTQVQANTSRSDNPLIHDGLQVVPNMTHVVSRDQKMFFYYEVYEPGLTAANLPDVRTSIAFYRGKVKVLETPVVARETIDVEKRKATLFQFEVPGGSFEPGLYTCQVNVID